ncbi:MAG: leucyl aminopeptidase [Verrucomicrobiota bacterium]
MNIRLISQSSFSQPLPAVVVFAFQKERPVVPVSLKPVLQRLTGKEFDGSDKQLLLVHTSDKPGVRAARVLLVGLGKRAEFNLEKLRRATGNAVKRLSSLGLNRAGIQLQPDTTEALQAVVEAAVLAGYKFTEFKAENHPGKLKALTISTQVELPAAKFVVQRAQIIAESTNFTRSIANLPGNVVYPAVLAERARTLADEFKLTCLVFDKAALEKDGFGGLLAVGGGSSREPHLIVLEYNGGPVDQKPFAIVGKAITFDSGGISLKPGNSMDEMKFDKSGGCAVLGIMRAAALLKLPVNLIGVIAAAENMPSATSYRPGDIVTSYKGTDKRGITIEVLNTDAEGRVVLGDAIVYARQRGAQVIVDFATLTGGCVVALGNLAAGLFSTDTALGEKIQAAGERTGERCWPLPLWPDYRDNIKSDVADHKNIGGRGASAIAGAVFLEKYAGKVPWAHVDIAGTANITEERPYLAKGATGFGVRLMLDLLSQWK